MSFHSQYPSQHPNSEDEYREIATAAATMTLAICIDNYFKRAFGGYRFTPATLDEFKRAVAGVMDVIRCGKVECNAALHAWEVAKIKAQTAKADPAAQRFMQQAIGVTAKR